ncbi:hypothetical protein BC941DRAFT_438165 [Chlamydoabsidia padenii]|nr:hypothetical protein BC941DRAFT_438165 [Chlamydoabsidia padenii]
MPTIVFDFLGTLVEFNEVITTIRDIWQYEGLGDGAKSLFEDWYQTSLMDYVASSHSGVYQPFTKVLRGSLSRTIYQRLTIFPLEHQVDKVMEAFTTQLTCPSLQAIQLALNQGWTVWIITLTDRTSTWDCLKQLGVVDPTGSLNVMCCDEYNVAIPHPKIYTQIMLLTVRHTQKIQNFYMASSHAWVLEGAKNASMRTVFLSNQELVYPTQVYNGKNPDLQGNHLMDCVHMVLQYEQSLHHHYSL